jgi:putative restriction endonuclease
MVAILYEPRDDGRGRMSYVGWARLEEPPYESPRRGARGERLWRVDYTSRVEEFENPVPFRYLGEPLESWLKPTTGRSISTRGRSVRWIDPQDAVLIMQLGKAGPVQTELSPVVVEPKAPLDDVAERSRRMVASLERDARFRRDVMEAYGFRCSITGLGIGSLPQGRVSRLLDAAHIRPVGDRGRDAVSNGLALTPTVHRLFDAGLLTARWQGSALALVRSPELEVSMIESPTQGTTIRLETGMALLLPRNPADRPSADQIRYHQRQIFRGPESLVS